MNAVRGKLRSHLIKFTPSTHSSILIFFQVEQVMLELESSSLELGVNIVINIIIIKEAISKEHIKFLDPR